jgi:AcrR family transcriptional regulator
MPAVIIDSARRYLMLYGSAKISMVEVARVGEISRGSVYKYFPERDALVAAVAELAFANFAADLDDAMAAAQGLEDQIVAAAGTVRRWDNAIRGVGGASLLAEDEVARLVNRTAAPMMRRMIDVVQPHLDAALARGELRPELDPALAAEWVARILHSLSTNPAVRFDADDPDQLEGFLRAHLLHGLAVPAPVRAGR